MELDVSTIRVSKNDLRCGLKLPRVMTLELAEFIGIMMGDGHLGYYRGTLGNGKRYVNYQIKVAGNKAEKIYLESIMSLFRSLFSLELKYTQDTAPNAIILRKQSKGVLHFLNQVCGIPINSKVEIAMVPEIILKSQDDNIKRAFLRGLADTDFSVCFKNKYKTKHCYPVIKGTFKSKRLIQDLELLFQRLDLRYSTYYDEERHDSRFGDYINHSIYLNGKDNFHKWIQTIGFSNPKFQVKVQQWLKHGFCPPGYK